MQCTYLGTNALLLRKAGTTIMVDPHFTRPGLCDLLGKISAKPQIIAAELAHNDVDRLDGILLTHTHYDHALDAVEVLRQAGGMLYGCCSAINLVHHAGINSQEITMGVCNKIGAFNVIFHPSRHLPFPTLFSKLLPMEGQIRKPLETPTWFWQYPSGKVWAIQVDQTLIFGSAGYQPGAYQGLAIENVVLGIGGLDLQPTSYLDGLYEQTVLHSGAKHVYLSHWDNFFKPASQGLKPHFLVRRAITRIKALGKQNGQTIHILKYQEPLTIKTSAKVNKRQCRLEKHS